MDRLDPMSLSDDRDEELRKDLLRAKERDLKPLLEEGVRCLDLDREQALAMDGFLHEAWFGGTRSAHAQMRERTIQRRFDIAPVGVAEIEAEFKALMEESADALNLTVGLTVRMWGFLSEAWIAGTQTCEAELMATFFELRSDVSEEAQKWLEGKRDGGTQDN